MGRYDETVGQRPRDSPLNLPFSNMHRCVFVARASQTIPPPRPPTECRSLGGRFPQWHSRFCDTEKRNGSRDGNVLKANLACQNPLEKKWILTHKIAGASSDYWRVVKAFGHGLQSPFSYLPPLPSLYGHSFLFLPAINSPFFSGLELEHQQG